MSNLNWATISGVSIANNTIVVGNYLYGFVGNGSVYRIDLTTGIVNSSWSTIASSQLTSNINGYNMATYGGYLYTSASGINNYNSQINKIQISTGISTIIDFKSIIGTDKEVWGLTIIGSLIYIIVKPATDNGSSFYTIDIFDNSIINILISNLSFRGIFLTSVGNIIYGFNLYSKIFRMDINNPTAYEAVWATIISPPDPNNLLCSLTIYQTDLYVCKTIIGSISSVIKISLSTPTDISTYFTYSSTDIIPICICQDNDYFYLNQTNITDISSSTISRFEKNPTPPIPEPPCFHEDTLITTLFGNIPVKYLSKGMPVKTLNNHFKKIEMIGRTTFKHRADTENRSKDQLYICSQEKYPDLFSDLILTGCHSILVDSFTSEKEMKDAIDINKGRLCMTENKYRLPACVDERAVVYGEKGSYTIYHVALENDDYFMNYGIYANGLLVESCSLRYLKELSGMTLL